MQENTVRRIYVEKKPGFDVEAQGLKKDFIENLSLKGLDSVRVINRYDVSGLEESFYQQAKNTIFSEPPVDNVYEEELPLPSDAYVFAVEYLPGQYDQRADSAAQCVQILTQGERPVVATAKVILLAGNLSAEQIDAIKNYYINPVESREATLIKPVTLDMQMDEPKDVAIIEGFIDMDDSELKDFMDIIGFAMNYEDLKFCQQYFKDTEKRNPTITELKVIDTYWSDHCRHTTFMTEITKVEFDEGQLVEPIKEAYDAYLKAREFVYGGQERDKCLMDMAVIGMKELRKQGKLDDLDASDEINACSIVVNVDVEGATEEWLIMFKNETHNHPTEIEPFGGAATCLGGCIRDPLSGRSYVYQAMRVTGSGDPRTRIEDTLPGKLPQRKITTEAAAGYSSYGNQIGLATGHVAEVYDEGFIAKRMEIGAVMAAAPKDNVVRSKPAAGDVIILAGGRTGRDGCGGATGSSKEHDEDSIFSCGAEVQKGNPPTERKIQRLFRNPEVSRMIKKCNDFGAGGVSVAIGELTDGLEINLDVIPKKYEGLDGTELAISESQERMAVVVAAENAERFIELAKEENVEATIVATVTDNRRLQMFWRNKAIVDISRDFLDTNGVKQQTEAYVSAPDSTNAHMNTLPEAVKEFVSYESSDKDNIQSTNQDNNQDINQNNNQEINNQEINKTIQLNKDNFKKAWLANLADLNVCSQKGLVENFDSTIGAGTVLMPFGGRYQGTPTEGMAAKVPVLHKETTTATIMTHGYNPKLSKWSPFHGALYAVIEAVAKVVAIGGDYEGIRLTLQEYFEKLGNDKTKWGKPLSALLGAYVAQKEFGIPAIGGKDSMSGTFKDIHVPPTLVAFAVKVADTRHIISPEFKAAGNQVVVVQAERDSSGIIDFQQLKKNYKAIHSLIQQGKVLSAHTVKYGGLAEAISKMTFGNRVGVQLSAELPRHAWFTADYGSIVLEIPNNIELDAALSGACYQLLGHTTDLQLLIVNNQEFTLEELYREWEKPLETIFPTKTDDDLRTIDKDASELVMASDISQIAPNPKLIKSTKGSKYAKPRVIIPVFPGTNCEYDTERAFLAAGAAVDTLIIKNLTAKDIELSVDHLVDRINQAQIMMLPGGFSGGDEPDGSGKFYATLFRNPRIQEAVMSLIQKRDGLVLGICNGFQALIKLGLLPYGEIREMTEESPTLTYNRIGRHISCMAMTKIISDRSPWFNNVKVGDVHNIPFSHGEGRFVAPLKELKRLSDNGQIATQYVDLQGQPSYDIRFNPNGSMFAIEGITSPDGRVLGKMGHSERLGDKVGINVDGNKDQKLFAAGVRYFG